MFFDSSTLFFIAGLLYLIIFITLLLKKRATLRGQAAFLCIYAGSVFWLSIYCFPFSTSGDSYLKGWSLIPFGNLSMSVQTETAVARSILSSILRYLLVAFALAVVFGFCFNMLAHKSSLGATLLQTTALLVGLQVLGIWCMLFRHTTWHPFDTSVLLADLLGAILGFFCFRLLEKWGKREEKQA